MRLNKEIRASVRAYIKHLLKTLNVGQDEIAQLKARWQMRAEREIENIAKEVLFQWFKEKIKSLPKETTKHIRV